MTQQFITKKGFTLIEMLVAVALFSIVLVIALGSIMTIVDVNKKSQTLTTVMNDLNFVLENMTRSIKTGQIDVANLPSGDLNSLTVTDQDGVKVTYAISGGGVDARKYITRKEGTSGPSIPITSEQINIEELRFKVFYSNANRQPRVLMVVRGTAAASQSISSAFTIQTTVSQRDLETENFK